MMTSRSPAAGSRSGLPMPTRQHLRVLRAAGVRGGAVFVSTAQASRQRPMKRIAERERGREDSEKRNGT